MGVRRSLPCKPPTPSSKTLLPGAADILVVERIKKLLPN
jgi:hypothetical protein